MRVKAMDGEAEILRLRDKQVMKLRVSALGSTHKILESWAVMVGREPC